MNFAPGLVRPGAFPHEILLSQLGKKEESRNRGPFPDKVLSFVGLDPAGRHAWCCAGFVWACHEAGFYVPKTASVRRMSEHVARVRIAVPEVGCGMIHFQPGGQHGHILFFLGLTGINTIDTVSCNTSAMGSREGDGIYRVDHTWQYVRENGGFLFRLRREDWE